MGCAGKVVNESRGRPAPSLYLTCSDSRGMRAYGNTMMRVQDCCVLSVCRVQRESAERRGRVQSTEPDLRCETVDS
jgi:hypothetical protein